MKTKVRVGIAGGAGYTAGELIRILMHHPMAELTAIQSESQPGKKVASVHTDLIGETEQVFVSEIDFNAIDVLFLCKGHGESLKYLTENKVPDALSVIDLSHDFRLKTKSNGFLYGLPELNKDAIRGSKRVANPGCFATSIQLGLLPAANSGFIQGELHISGITGSTGAGQALAATSHFSWRSNNIGVYKPFTHQHLEEISESLAQVGLKNGTMNFIPYRGSFTRGIITTAYFDTSVSLESARIDYQEFYKDHPFTMVVSENPDVKQVVNTNKALIYLEKHGNKLMVISVIDNLLKGASGQAVQNMNLMFGLEETMGLWSKPSAF